MILIDKIKKKRDLPESTFEKDYWENHKVVAGIDEAGRGCLAGPVVAAAIILPVDFENTLGIDDSKLLSQKKREFLFNYFMENSFPYGIGIIDNHIIDEINILEATHLAIKAAYSKLVPQPDHLLIDGNHFRGFNIPFTQIICGDRLSVSIASASIIAKVERDRIMKEVYSVQYPEYHFDTNKGYGTKEHISALKQFGPIEIHRKSFIKKIIFDELTLF
jgi:ribonuclease HII